MLQLVFVEDDPELAGLIADFLLRHEMQTHIVPRGDEAMAAIERLSPDLVLLDIMLPGMDGLTLCRELRPRFQGPIVMLTALDSDMNQILGLELGANDFILKTTPPSVLLARLRAQLRHHHARPLTSPSSTGKTIATAASSLRFGQLQIDPRSRDVRLADQAVVLSTADFDLLWELASHAGEIMSREQLFKLLRGMEYDGLDRSVDVAISRLRRKLDDHASEPTRIKTVRNRGYLLAPNAWD
jgi:Response regulators consisting of a CheY-like receiver domain and a winged-helix DNA-binding domain